LASDAFFPFRDGIDAAAQSWALLLNSSLVAYA